ncbi:MAG: hypothetical protein Q8W46_05050 [Candidatus Palauibacterales bacterium]|nr:hypothetical protein [Candidatus Palauibacterales bacterium]
MIGRVGLVSSIAVLVAVFGACTEDPVSADSAADAPGISTPTIEVSLDPAELPAWRDTTYEGFAVPSTVPYAWIADREDLQARPLGRFTTIPDSVFVDTSRVAIDRFTSAVIRLTIDTASTAVPPGGAELAVWSLARSFDADEATWQLAREGEAWDSPGGDLDALLAIDSVTIGVDSLWVPADTVLLEIGGNADSLLSAWRDNEGEPGLAVVLNAPGGRIRVNSLSLVAEAVPEGIDTVISVVRGVNPSTFIYDPPTPATTTRLRLAGLPAARYYVQFQLPNTLGLIPLRGATINRATLEFRPTAAPPDPFALTGNISAQPFRLLADPFVYGEKTPIGAALGPSELLRPDSLANGNTMEFDITPLIKLWTQISPDSTTVLRIGIVSSPENQQSGYWEFFSSEDGAGLRPIVHLLFTPNPSFLLP